MGTAVSIASCEPLLAATACAALSAHRLRECAQCGLPCCACCAAHARPAFTWEGAKQHR